MKDNLPNAEWIVAHLSVEYPELFLPALVDIGLKQMHEFCDPQGLPLHLTMGGVSTGAIKINLLESISYLSRFHKRLVQVELFSPLKKSVLENRTRFVFISFLQNNSVNPRLFLFLTIKTEKYQLEYSVSRLYFHRP